jgi:hypothetical protein
VVVLQPHDIHGRYIVDLRHLLNPAYNLPVDAHYGNYNLFFGRGALVDGGCQPS